MRRPSSSLLTKLLLSCTAGLIGCGNNGSNNYSSIVPANPEKDLLDCQTSMNSVACCVEGGVRRNELEQAAADFSANFVEQVGSALIDTMSPVSSAEILDFFDLSRTVGGVEVFVKKDGTDGWTKNLPGVCEQDHIDICFVVPKGAPAETPDLSDGFVLQIYEGSIFSNPISRVEITGASRTCDNGPPDFIFYRPRTSVASLEEEAGRESAITDTSYIFEAMGDFATVLVDSRCDGPITPPWTPDEDETDIRPGNYYGTVQCDFSIEETNGQTTSDRASFDYSLEVNSHGLPLTTDGQVPRRGVHSSLDLGDVVIEADVTSAAYSSSSATIESTVSMDFGDESLTGEQSEVVRTTNDSDVISYYNSSAYDGHSSDVHELRLSCSGNLTRQ